MMTKKINKKESKEERFVKNLRWQYEIMYRDLNGAIVDLANGEDRLKVQNKLETVLSAIDNLNRQQLESVLR